MSQAIVLHLTSIAPNALEDNVTDLRSGEWLLAMRAVSRRLESNGREQWCKPPPLAAIQVARFSAAKQSFTQQACKGEPFSVSGVCKWAKVNMSAR